MTWGGLGVFITKNQLITKLIAVFVLVWTLCLLASLDGEDIALIAIFSGIAGSAATFLFAPHTNSR